MNPKQSMLHLLQEDAIATSLLPVPHKCQNTRIHNVLRSIRGKLIEMQKSMELLNRTKEIRLFRYVSANLIAARLVGDRFYLFRGITDVRKDRFGR
jgi:hypothetical protein